MSESILVNFHCHSIFSDGELTPESLAANLAAAGVRYASLTDHDSIDGLPRFQEALKKRGIAMITGVELTTQFKGREAHLLAYGFDPQHSDLAATLVSLRQVRSLEVHSIAGSLRKVGSNRANGSEISQSASAAPNGQLEIGEAIELIHQAGGCAFLAHPLYFESDLEKLADLIGELKILGLDGIEVIYAPFSQPDQASLRSIAETQGLLVCAGTDFHGTNGPGSPLFAIQMPREDWIKFRNAVFSGQANSSGESGETEPFSPLQTSHSSPSHKPHHFRRRAFVLRIFLPTLVAIGLFMAAFWFIILPSFEQTLLERKREMIRELTNSAWSILVSYHQDELTGLVTREQAQAMAKERIEALRYGPEGKDYFWIQDTEPRMIMHPYRSDLNGQELYSFTDPRGVAIFVEFAELVKSQGEGYIDYVWQWKDDPQRLEPKESFVKGFSPWEWIIGTGIYMDDVNQEIARIEQSLITTSLIISGAIILLLLFVLQQTLRIERQRQEVLDDLRESTQRYHSLVEATTEGTLLVLDDRCRYANPTFLSMLDYNQHQLEFLELADLLPRDPGNQSAWLNLQNLNGETPSMGQTLEGYLVRSDGSQIECILTINPIQYAGQRGFILLAKDITRNLAALGADGLNLATQAAPVGIFRGRAARRGVFVELNPAARDLLPQGFPAEGSQPALADFFADPTEFEQVLQKLLSEGEIKNYILQVVTRQAARSLSLSMRLVRDEHQHPAYIDGLVEDVTTEIKQKAEREALIDKLQASFLFLHEPIANLGRDVLVCRMDTSIEQLARLMTVRHLTAALVASENMAVIGIITDHDLRVRALAEKVDLSAPIHTIMSAPIMKIPAHALIYEALIRMEEKGVSHLAVEDENGQIINVIDAKSLIQFQHYGPMVLTREISRSQTPADVARSSERTSPLVKALIDSSARPRHVTSMLASICDAASERLIQLALADLGPPPAPFVFVAMGSQGRQEQTLLTDQDNGIIYSPDEKTNPEMAADYFMKLGSSVCESLNLAGYPFCQGRVMASNPRWCRSLPEWLAGFNAWVQTPESQEIIDLSIFFDFRPVFGDAELSHEMRRHIHAVLLQSPAFFNFYAQNSLMFKPPLRLLGNIYLSGGATEHAGEINLKDAMMPIVSFARLYALRHQINQTNTLKRIEALAERNIILPSSRDEITTAYDFLMQLRLQNQLAAIQAGKSPNNLIHPGKLGYIQQEMLKQAFAQISIIQKRVGFDFPGSA